MKVIMKVILKLATCLLLGWVERLRVAAVPVCSVDISNPDG